MSRSAERLVGRDVPFSYSSIQGLIMPRKKSTRSSATRPAIEVGQYYLENDAPWGGFINIRLSDDEHEAFDVWYSAHESEVGRMLVDLLAVGMKVGFAYDAEHQAFITTFTGALLPDDGSRFCMTSRAGTFNESLGLSCWKHFVLAAGDYGSYRPRAQNFSSWG